jgi:hypothetical protein
MRREMKMKMKMIHGLITCSRMIMYHVDIMIPHSCTRRQVPGVGKFEGGRPHSIIYQIARNTICPHRGSVRRCWCGVVSSTRVVNPGRSTYLPHSISHTLSFLTVRYIVQHPDPTRPMHPSPLQPPHAPPQTFDVPIKTEERARVRKNTRIQIHWVWRH